MGHIFAYLTGDKVTFTEGDDSGDGYTEEHGWINEGEPFELEESRNYVEPVVALSEADPELTEHVRWALENAPGGPFWDNGDGSFYGQSEELRSEGGSDVSWTYALHFVRKSHGSKGWTEEAWHPSEGGVDISDLIAGGGVSDTRS